MRAAHKANSLGPELLCLGCASRQGCLLYHREKLLDCWRSSFAAPVTFLLVCGSLEISLTGAIAKAVFIFMQDSPRTRTRPSLQKQAL